MANSSGGAASLAGRVLICLVFLGSGIQKVMNFQMTVGFAAAKHLLFPEVAIGAAATLEILGGLAILTGFHTKVASWLLFLFLIPTTLTFHNFWTMSGMERMDNQGHFMKNLAIMGAY
jgi:putative oxidoreductase